MGEAATEARHPFDIINDAGEIRDGRTLTGVLVELAKVGCIIAEPMRAGMQVPDDHVVMVNTLQTDAWESGPKGDDFSQHWERYSTRGDFASPTKLLLDQLAKNAGLTTVFNDRVDPPEGETGIAWRVILERKDLAGDVVRTPGDRLEKRGERDGVSKAQTRARKRAICAALGISTKFPPRVAGTMLVTCRLMYRPVKGDAEFDKAARLARLAQQTGLGDALYGQKPALPDPAQTTTIDAPQQPAEQPAPNDPEPPADDADDLGAEIRALVDIARGLGKSDPEIADAAKAANLSRQAPTREAVDAFGETVKTWQQPPAEPPQGGDDEDVPF